MLIFDQLKHDERKLRAISIGVMAGLLILLAGLWWVQIVSAKRYEENLKDQSFRSVRVPALRGSIQDRNGQSLAENRPRFDVNLYLEDLRPQFTAEYPKVVRDFTNQNPGVKIRGEILAGVNREARYRVVSNIVTQVSSTLQQSYTLDPVRFGKHYSERPYIPFPAMQNLTPKQVALFAENFTGMRGVEMEVYPMRTYPNGSSTAHLLGYIQRHDKPADDDEITYKYYLPDFIGRTGVEASFDNQLRGKAGVKSLLVNNIGYRQREEMLSVTEPGQTLALTIDLRLQRAAETALAGAMANVRGAVVVMDVRNGDVLALVSLPAFDPNVFPTGVSSTDWNRLNNDKYSYMFNRATYGAYPPGSVLKILTAIACFESNVVNPSESFHEPGYFENSKLLGKRRIKSLAPPGDYDFRRAFIKSSNTYFIHYGLKAGLKKLVEVGERFHMGETTGILPGEEVSGDYPHSSRLAGWYAGNTANLCIGQEITVTPIQVAAMISAIANGGKLYWPRIIKDLRPAGSLEADSNLFQPGSLRANTRLNPRHLELIHRAMLADVEDNDGTGTAARVEGFRVGGKTGTAEGTKEDTTWFASFGPVESPRYAVVVMVQGGASGGGTCAPVAGKIYKAILNLEQTGTAAPKTLAELKLMYEANLNERKSILDWPLLLSVLGLMGLGIAFIYSASFANESARTLPWFKQLYAKQIIWYELGLVCIIVLCIFDYRTLSRWAIIGYWVSILLLIAVMLFGTERFGAKRWIMLGPFQLQPSEFAKVAFIFMMANFLSRPVEELRQRKVFWTALGMIALPFLLILKEPDLGSALVFFPIGLLMMLVAGVPVRYLAKFVGGVGLLIILILVDVLFVPIESRWQVIKLENYQRHRLLTYFGQDFASKDATPAERKKAKALQASKSYNVEQALISVGSGGLTGKGWRQGTQYSLGFLPRAVAHNDFIFSVIAEEKGFVGSVFVVTLYAVVLFSGIKIASQARDRLGKILAVGVVALLFSHIFINIGMNIRLMPVTGIPLPLLSYGGSSVLCSLIAIGILQNVHMYRRAY